MAENYRKNKIADLLAIESLMGWHLESTEIFFECGSIKVGFTLRLLLLRSHAETSQLRWVN